jgi:hypothetical protein
MILPQISVDQVCYWYSLWSHRRGDQLWKGFAEVDLDPSDDVNAEAVLKAKLDAGT